MLFGEPERSNVCFTLDAINSSWEESFTVELLMSLISFQKEMFSLFSKNFFCKFLYSEEVSRYSVAHLTSLP